MKCCQCSQPVYVNHNVHRDMVVLGNPLAHSMPSRLPYCKRHILQYISRFNDAHRHDTSHEYYYLYTMDDIEKYREAQIKFGDINPG